MDGHRGDYLGVNYAGFAPLLVESVKYLDGVVSRHERELDAMQARIQVKVDSIKRPRTPRNHDTASIMIVFKARVRCYFCAGTPPVAPNQLLARATHLSVVRTELCGVKHYIIRSVLASILRFHNK